MNQPINILDTLAIDLYKEYIFPLLGENPDDCYVFAQVSSAIYKLVNELFFKNEIVRKLIPLQQNVMYSVAYSEHFRNTCRCLVTTYEKGLKPISPQQTFTVFSMLSYLKMDLHQCLNNELTAFQMGIGIWWEENYKTADYLIQCCIEADAEIPPPCIWESDGVEIGKESFLQIAMDRGSSERTLKLIVQSGVTIETEDIYTAFNNNVISESIILFLLNNFRSSKVTDNQL